MTIKLIFVAIFIFGIIGLVVGSSYLLDKKTQCRVINSTFCEMDSDCICGGIDIATNGCFFGNNIYYEKCVDKTKECPDFCGGITGGLEIKCENNKCVQR